MNEEHPPAPAPEDVEAHLLKEALAAGTASAAIFAGTTQAASYPGPLPPGTEDAAAELALIPADSDRAVQQKATKKSAKAKKVAKPTPADRRARPE